MGDIKRRVAGRNAVVTGSVWESRMKSDEVKGGIKVFNAEENSEEGGGGGGGDKKVQVHRRMKRIQNGGVTGKRKTWNERGPFQMRKTRSELRKVSDEPCKDLSVSVDSMEKSAIQMRKTKSEPHRVSDESCKELGLSVDGTEKSPIQLRKTRSDSHYIPDETPNELPINREKIMSRSVSNVSQVSQVNSPRRLGVDDDGIDADGEDEGEDEEDDIDVEVEQESYDVKEVTVAEEIPDKISEQKLEKVEEEEEKKVHQIPEKPLPISPNVNEKPSPVIDRPVIDLTQPKKIVNEEKKAHQILEKPKHIFSKVNKRPSPARNPPLIDHSLRKPAPIAVSEVFDRSPDTPNKLQNLVDLVMWRDVSKSAFVFGVGTFFLLSSSFTRDLNFSLISAISYMGLIYLAAIFFNKSILCRGATDMDDSNEEYRYIVGEQEAIWVLKLILPYLNEFLLKLRSIFSGDPATTMKLAVLLFVLARCGGSITVWKMAKLGFFAVFTVPKVCSSYSNQLTAYGKFWIGRFRDAWDSCTHKKAVAAAVFTLVWNFSSVIARIWAVFMLVVALRYYQQSSLSEEWGEEGVRVEGEDSGWREGDCGGQRQEHGGPIVLKEKKGC